MELLERTAAPDVNLITTAEAKAQLRVKHSAEDTLIDSLIDTVEGYLDGPDGALNRALITQTWALSFCKHGAKVYLPLNPVQSVDSITYYDQDNVQQTLTVSDFWLVKNKDESYLVPKDGVQWPATYSRADAITITFVCGYGDAASDVPAGIRQAALMLLTHWYENRSAVVIGTSAAEIPMTAELLINQHKLGWFA